MCCRDSRLHMASAQHAEAQPLRMGNVAPVTLRCAGQHLHCSCSLSRLLRRPDTGRPLRKTCGTSQPSPYCNCLGSGPSCQNSVYRQCSCVCG